MKILQLTSHFSPNVGGVETHLDDLVKALTKRGNNVFVLTYRPITTTVSWEVYESKNNLQVFRIPWLPGFFYKLVDKPLIEFLYLLPGLFIATPIVLLIKQPEVVHSHGLVAGFVAVFWGKVFGKRVITTTHSIYEFPQSGLYRNFAAWIFNKSNYVLTLSKQSANEVEKLGVSAKKIRVFTYWIDLKRFKIPSFAKATKGKQDSKLKAKSSVGWEGKFVVLFASRLVPEKGVYELLEANRKWNENITLAIAGTGPLESNVKSQMSKVKNLEFLGQIDNEKLPQYYSAADVVIVPSTHEEGFGRVILESLACGTPVIAAKRGAIPEAMDETVGKFIKVSPKNIKNAVEYFYKNPDELKKLAKNARKYAEKRYSEKNVEKIIKAYKG